ncbi:activating transcription factor 4b [Melanotaenia boesemani]|uniref:activating transcription factor 4b n=1 Tax=Melanotaenia boesemani TaxID=1250792 RepID=UPI001C05747D|nr:activating transcription factor 4b [Melanotaenia boesemani]
MTMTMTSSQFGLADMEALLWGPSSPMADVMDFVVIPDKDGQQERGTASLEGDTSPVSPIASSSLSSSSSPPPFYSPPPSPPAVLHGNKAGTESDLLPLPWLGDPGQLRCSQMSSDDSEEDVLSDLDWMAERMDLSEFDLDSLIDSCGPAEESPSSPEEFLASLDCPVELDSFQLPSLPTCVTSSPSSASAPSVVPSVVLPSICSDVITVDDPESHIEGQEVPSSPLYVPDPQEELEIKSEPASPDPSPPAVDSPCSPDFTLDLGSEVDVSESEVKPVVTSVVPQVPRIVLSLSPTRIVLVLAPKNQVGITAPSEVINHSPPVSPPERFPRSRPYPEPKHTARPPSPSVIDNVKAVRAAGGVERVTLKAPKDKKKKKMEQNKTAATRYRQKKRAEQEMLLEEYGKLERKNMELTEKAESMAREIEYLKELMEEVCQTRRKKGLSADP